MTRSASPVMTSIRGSAASSSRAAQASGLSISTVISVQLAGMALAVHPAPRPGAGADHAGETMPHALTPAIQKLDNRPIGCSAGDDSTRSRSRSARCGCGGFSSPSACGQGCWVQAGRGLSWRVCSSTSPAMSSGAGLPAASWPCSCHLAVLTSVAWSPAHGSLVRSSIWMAGGWHRRVYPGVTDLWRSAGDVRLMRLRAG